MGQVLTADTGDMDWALDGAESEFSEASKAAIANLTILSFTQSACNMSATGNATCPEDKFTSDLPSGQQSENLLAISCALYPCMKQYHAKVEQGVLTEKVVGAQPVNYNKLDGSPNGPDSERAIDVTSNRTGIQFPCLIEKKEYNMENFSRSYTPPTTELSSENINGTNYTIPNQCLYKLGHLYSEALARFMRLTLFNGKCDYSPMAGSSVDCEDKWWLLTLYNSTYSDLDLAFNQFTTAITNNFRTQGSKGPYVKEIDSVVGLVTEVTVCTDFDWRWILLPAILMLITLAMLVFAVVQSYTNPAMPVWKTSILPLLFYGPNVSDDQARSETDLDELQKQAGKMIVKFQDEGGVRLREVDTTATHG
ncbi:hypothetical protein FSARC_9658 [Fusarium sarcochroum]|uniref:Uncharacterized protein n=1 Tax=Fusarium sarcochroum TaxID=1208366 RepID=A0A8H4X5Y8_9HYPO|nr:hypothetical protein FSARC_9658 [Fusarium sarcochroum]